MTDLILDADIAALLGTKKVYNRDRVGAHVRIWLDGKNVYLHRFIMRAKPGEVVDHINGNPLDNRRANLRIVTAAENQSNRVKLEARNVSGYRGVARARGGRWRAVVQVRGKQRHLGYFDSAVDAGKVAREFRLANLPGALS